MYSSYHGSEEKKGSDQVPMGTIALTTSSC